MRENTLPSAEHQARPRQSAEEFTTVLMRWADADCRYREVLC